MYGGSDAPQGLLPAAAKSVGNTWAVLADCTSATCGTPLSRYCACSASIGLTPTVASLVPVNRYTCCVATFEVASMGPPLQLSIVACIVASMAGVMTLLFWQFWYG
jgi:hypothetical protein